ncbi:hypothetical protein C7448_1052 [Tenacibaculum gallaicum]|uniref:DUF1272 domain-containing protein n=1 Tax=Tenacibaculum gallaicum TaxID=561505 RepID=A0A3E0HR65_9FLAO|nr:DUF1272 domain-containing protein [Tenacibaculum gallaicum]REH48726.1 hypothetical protein C7448_1052 [Tenacibaculum gallaicum]
MLEIRPNCEHCGKDLPNTSTEAMICTFECTYCKDCAINLFENVCPTCSGNFAPRPIRPKKYIANNPASLKRVYDPKNIGKAKEKRLKFIDVLPENR